MAGADDAGVAVGVGAGPLDVGVDVGVGVGVLVARALAVGPAALRLDVDGAVATVPGLAWRAPAGAEVVPRGAGVVGPVVSVAVALTGGIPTVGSAARSRLREAWSPPRTAGSWSEWDCSLPVKVRPRPAPPTSTAAMTPIAARCAGGRGRRWAGTENSLGVVRRVRRAGTFPTLPVALPCRQCAAVDRGGCHNQSAISIR